MTASVSSRGDRFRGLPPWIVLLGGILVTLIIMQEFHKQGQRRDEARFQNEVTRITNRIKNRMDAYTAMLLGGTGFFAASDHVTEAEFQTYINHLRLDERYPGIQGIGFAQRITAEQRADLAQMLRQRGDFTIRPDQGQSEMVLIIYLEPQDIRNLAAIGYDMFSEQVRREAMERARDTGEPAASGRVTLVQEIDEDQQAGFLIYVPLYQHGATPQTLEQRRNQLVGYIYSPFRAGDLLEGIFDLDGFKEVDFQVFDGQSTDSLAMLFDTQAHRQAVTASTPLQTIVSLTIAGRPWTLQVSARPEFYQDSDSARAWYVGGIGLIISVLLAAVTWLQVNARRLTEQRRLAAQEELDRRREIEQMLVVRNRELQDTVSTLQTTREELTQQNVELAVTRNTIERERRRYRHLFEFAPDGSLVTDTQGIIREANHAAARMLNVPQPELLGRPVADFVEKGSLPLLENLIEQVLREGRVDRSELRFCPVDDATFDGAVTAAVIRDDGQRPIGLQWLLRDITASNLAQRALVREKNFSDAVIASLPGMFYVVDEHGRLVRWNQRLEQVTHYSAEQIARMHPAEFFEPAVRERVRSQMMQVFTRGFATVEAGLQTADGSTIPHLVTGHKVVLDGRPYIVGVAIDIAERVAAEQELAQHRAHLEQLVHVRTQELEQSHQRLRLSERMAALGTLSAGLGHDMGNLLLPVRLRLDSLEAKAGTQEIKEDIQAIRKSAEYLQRLVNGLRLFALDPNDEGASGQQTHLDEWWADVHPFLRNALPREIEFENDWSPGLPAVNAPRHLLTQAVFNLVQNAGEIMKPRGWGMVRVWARPSPDGRYVRLGVTDNGPGMTQTVRQRCIEPFFTTKTRGLSTGLGLALVHGILNKIGGKMEIESEPGHGATFVLVIPSAASPATDADKGRTRLRAILSLQDPRLQAYVASVLQSLAFQVEVSHVENGHDAEVWVTDAMGDSDAARAFLSAGDERRLIVVGSQDQAVEQDGTGVVMIEAKPTLIRQALQQVADDLRSS